MLADRTSREPLFKFLVQSEGTLVISDIMTLQASSDAIHVLGRQAR